MAKPITPEQLAASGSEDGHQAALFCWAALMRSTYPELRYMFAIPNGGKRHIIDASKLKAMGVKAGAPDILLPVKRGEFFSKHHSGLFIELKRPKSVGKVEGITRDNQIDFMIFLQSQGFLCIVCVGWEVARDAIIDYLTNAIINYDRFKQLIPKELK